MELKYIGQMLAAFLGAAFVVNGICCFYHNPVVQVDNPAKYTECKTEANSYSYECGEGYGHIVTDDNGFNNITAFPYKDAEILCVGSSQTEGQNITSSENYVYLLNGLEPDSKYYNLGISGQRFANTLYRVSALKEYFPACRVMVFEVMVLPSEDELATMKEYMEQNEIPSKDLSWKNGNLALQIVGRIPLCRLLWQQYDHSRKKAVKPDNEPPKSLGTNYNTLLNNVLALAKQQAGNTPIVMFHLPSLEIKRDGTMAVKSDGGKMEAMRLACAKQGIYWVDMGDVFLKEYTDKRLVPYGFTNSRVASGHLNPQGHRMIAETLNAVLTKEGLVP